MPLKLAGIQMSVVCGQRETNLQHAEELIREAARNGADVALLPEAMDVGWTQPASQTDAETIPDGVTCRRLMEAAAENGIFVCAGLTERDGSRVYNSAVLIDRDGNHLCTHRKINELEIGHQFYAQGDRLSVVETELGTIGLMICADAFANDKAVTQALCYLGADIILSPTAWAVEADHDNAKDPYGGIWRDGYIPIAEKYQVWIAGVSNVGDVAAGPWAGWKCIGCSLIVGPEGEAAFGPYGADAETILYVDVEPRERPARGEGWKQYWSDRDGA